MIIAEPRTNSRRTSPPCVSAARLWLPLIALAGMLWLIAPTGAALGQDAPPPAQPNSSNSAAQGAAAPDAAEADRAGADAADNGKPDLTQAEEKFVRADWSLVTFEDKKVGFINKEHRELHVDGKLVGHRLIINRFMKMDLLQQRPTFHQESTLDMDASWQAVSFKTETRRDRDLTTISGRVEGNTLKVSITSGDETRTYETQMKSRPTFAGAFIQAIVASGLRAGMQYAVTTIDEATGSYSEAPRLARALQKTRVQSGDGAAEVFVVLERSSIFETMHWVYPGSGRIYRSEGGAHHLSVRESSISESMGLKLEGTVEYQKRIAIQNARTLASDVFGYQLTMPAYPYMPVVFRDGLLVVFNNQTGHDNIMLMVVTTAAGGAEAREQVFETYTKRMVGTTGEVRQTPARVGEIEGTQFDGSALVGSRQGWFRSTIISRGDYYYIFSQVGVWPSTPGQSAGKLNEVLSSVEWTKIFGRERGRWDGAVYISESHNYRLQLMADAWQVPQERGGVATNVEVVRDDRSALVAVELIELDEGATLEQAVEQYGQRLRRNLPQAENIDRKPARIDNLEAVRLSYEARAIDDEPTESQHLLAVKGQHLLVLTLVTKKSDQAADNRAHYQAAVESFRFAPAGR